MLNEQIPAPKIPNNFKGDFFPTIKNLKDAPKDIDRVTLKCVYNFLMIGILSVDDEDDQRDDDNDDRDHTTRSLKTLNCELLYPETDWKRLWRLDRGV